MRRALLCSLFALGLLSAADAKTYTIKAGPNADADAQAAFAAAHGDDDIRFAEGRFALSRPLTLTADKIEVRGKGADKSVLDFTSMAGEGDGLTIHGNGIELRDFAVANAKGAAIVVSGANISIESVAAHGALGPGILLNGAQTAIIQKSEADGALDGFEVRNSAHVDLIDNAASNNGVGVLVDDQPGAPAGGAIRIVRNQIAGNAGQGIGVDIVAARDVAVLQNQIGEHGTANIFIRAFGGDAADPKFNALSRNITIIKNEFGRAGFKPASDWAPAIANGAVFGDIVWDGARSYVAGGAARTEPILLAIDDNSSKPGPGPRFLNLGLEAAGAPASEANPSPAWPPVAHFAMPEPVKVR